MYSRNLTVLRQIHKYSQEEVAEENWGFPASGGKWESGETAPDLINCDALAELYNVSVDDLIHFDQSKEKIEIPPKGKHIFGTVKVGERGQIVLPKKARDILLLNMENLSPLTDYFIIASADNVTLVKAVADNIEEKLAEEGILPSHTEG
mgnify:CR=1 FL=1